MSYKYTFDPLAFDEYVDAINWYKDKSENVAEQLISDAEERIKLICSDPHRYRQTHDSFREASLFAFPYYIVYSIDERNKVVIIFSFYHHKRNPKKKYRK